MKKNYFKFLTKIPPALILLIVLVAINKPYFFHYCISGAYSALEPPRLDFCIIYSMVTILATWILLILISSLLVLFYKILFVRYFQQKPELLTYARWVFTCLAAVALQTWQPLNYLLPK